MLRKLFSCRAPSSSTVEVLCRLDMLHNFMRAYLILPTREHFRLLSVKKFLLYVAAQVMSTTAFSGKI